MDLMLWRMIKHSKAQFIAVLVVISVGIAMFTAISRDDIPDYVDFYIMPLSPALELNLGKFMVFIRQEFRYATGAGENTLLGRNFFFVNGDFPMTGAGVVLKW